MEKLRSLKSLVHDGVDATVELVREGHESTARAVMRVTDQVDGVREATRGVDQIRRGVTNGVLGSVKAVNRVVEAVTDAGIDAFADPTEPLKEDALPMRSDVIGSMPWWKDAAIATLNGGIGDYLNTTGNGLEVEMQLRVGDHYVDVSDSALSKAFAAPSPHVAIFVHGLGATEWSWSLGSEAYYGEPGTTFGSMLEDDLGFSSVYVRYNTGRHVWQNGIDLAHLIEAFVKAYPVPIESLHLFGHSMGGLVMRSACHLAESEDLEWPGLVSHVFYMGSPHQGAPLAKLGHEVTSLLGAIDLPATRIISKILYQRSSGVKDLRYGDWAEKDQTGTSPSDDDKIPVPQAVHTFISGTISDDPASPAGFLLGDLLVRVPSASGPTSHAQTFEIHSSHHGRVMHHQIQNHPDVYQQILSTYSEHSRFR